MKHVHRPGVLFVVVLVAVLAPVQAAGGGRGEAAEGRPEASAPAPEAAAGLEPPADAGEPAYPLTVMDDQGTPVTLPRKPERIISLTAHTDDILFDLVEPRRLLGVTAFAADPAISNVADRAGVVAHKLVLNSEVILALQPDLVLVASWSEADKVALLRSAGVPVFLTASPLSIEAVQTTIRTLALLVGEPQRGEAMIQEMKRRLEAVWAKVGPLPDGERLRIMDYAVWGSAQGAGSSWDELVRRAGLVNAVGDLSADQWGQVPLSRERLLELDPDILVVPGWVYGEDGGSDAFLRQMTEDPALRSMKAIRRRQVCRLPEGLKTATSQYMADAVEYLARLAYPELFP